MKKSESSQSEEHTAKNRKSISGEAFDRLFDEGSEQIHEFIDWENASRPGLELKRVNLDLPTWVVERLDQEAQRLGVSRQAIMKTWLVDRLDNTPRQRNYRVAEEPSLYRQR